MKHLLIKMAWGVMSSAKYYGWPHFGRCNGYKCSKIYQRFTIALCLFISAKFSCMMSSLLTRVLRISCGFFFWASSSIHCLAALDLGASVEQPFRCFVVQKRQDDQSVMRSMDWTWVDNTVDGLFFCATLTGRRGGSTGAPNRSVVFCSWMHQG